MHNSVESNNTARVVILSVPFTVPVPAAAPALLSGCLNASGISAIGLDFSFSMYDTFCKQPWWPTMHSLLTLGTSSTKLPLTANVLMVRYVIRYLKNIKEKYNPEWIGLSLFTSWSLAFSEIMIRLIKKHLPNIKIVLGGRSLELRDGNNFFYDRYRDRKDVDLIIIGDAEVSFIDAIKNDRRGLVISPGQTQEDLDNIPVPDWSGYALQKYELHNKNLAGTTVMFPITASKGCVRKCTFCDVASFWPKYIYRDGTKVADTIISIYENTGISSFKFTDNLMNGSITNFRKMNERLVEKAPPNTIAYNGFAIFRTQQSSPEYDFEVSAKAGCKLVVLGTESGSEKVRKDMKKKFSNDDIEYSANQYFKNNIKQVWLFMVGYPTETEADFQETLRLLKWFSPMAKNNMLTVGVTPPFQVLPNSPLIMNMEIKNQYDFSTQPAHIDKLQHFWESSLNDENTYLIRAERWRRFVDAVIENKFNWSGVMDIDSTSRVVGNYEKIYKSTARKYIPIHQTGNQ